MTVNLRNFHNLDFRFHQKEAKLAFFVRNFQSPRLGSRPTKLLIKPENKLDSEEINIKHGFFFILRKKCFQILNKIRIESNFWDELLIFENRGFRFCLLKSDLILHFVSTHSFFIWQNVILLVWRCHLIFFLANKDEFWRLKQLFCNLGKRSQVRNHILNEFWNRISIEERKVLN